MALMSNHDGNEYKQQFVRMDFREVGQGLLANPSTANDEVVVHQQLVALQNEVAAIAPGLTQEQVESLIEQNIVGLFEVRGYANAGATNAQTATGEAPLPGYAYVVQTAGNVFGMEASVGDVVYYMANGTWGRFDNVDPSVAVDPADPVITVQRVGENEYRVSSKASFVQRVADLEADMSQAQQDIVQLNQGLTAERNTREQAVSDLQTQVTNLSQALQQEASARNQADQQLANSLATEVSARQQLQGRVDTAEATIAGHTSDIAAVNAALQTKIGAGLVISMLTEAVLGMTKKASLTRALDATVETLPSGHIKTTYYFEGFSTAPDFGIVDRRTGGAPFELYGDVEETLVPAASVPASIVRGRSNYFAKTVFIGSAPVDELRVTAVRCPDAAGASALVTGAYDNATTPALAANELAFNGGRVLMEPVTGALHWTATGSSSSFPGGSFDEVFVVNGTVYCTWLHNNGYGYQVNFDMTQDPIVNLIDLSQATYGALKQQATKIVTK